MIMCSSFPVIRIPGSADTPMTTAFPEFIWSISRRSGRKRPAVTKRRGRALSCRYMKTVSSLNPEILPMDFGWGIHIRILTELMNWYKKPEEAVKRARDIASRALSLTVCKVNATIKAIRILSQKESTEVPNDDDSLFQTKNPYI